MAVKAKYELLNYDETKGYYVCVSISKLVWVTVILPFFAFVFCVVWSLLYNFEETTFTHCKVWNYLPSISAAIGNHTVQYTIWCACITLHAVPRFFFVVIYHRHNLKVISYQKRYLVKLACLLSTVENLSLMGLTYVTSAGSYEFHKTFFMSFMITSELYMMLTCFMLKYARKNKSMDKFEHFSFRMKRRLLVVNVLSFITAGYFFIRHNDYCEPGIYTLFAFFEYIVVLSNMAFHLTALIDFRDEYLTVYRQGIDVR